MKIQSLWRGYSARKAVAFVRQTKRVKSTPNDLYVRNRLTPSTLQLTNRKRLSLNFKNMTPLLKGRRGLLTSLKLEPPTLGNGSEDSEMALGFKYGQMAPNMRVSKSNTYNLRIY